MKHFQLNESNYDKYLTAMAISGYVYHDPSLNCLHYDYTRTWHPRFWFSNICQFFRNIKYAYQRIVYGYCDRDIWNMDYHLMVLLADMLDDLAENTHGYPGIEPYTDYKDWAHDLHANAWKLRAAADYDNNYFSNPLYEKYVEELNERGITSSSDIVKNYLEMEQNRHQKQHQACKEAMEWITTYLSYLWD